MGRIRLGIYDRKAEYARSLGSYIRRYHGDSLEVKVFTGLEPLEECLGSGGLDVLLAGEEAEALCRQHKEVWTVILGEGSRDGTGTAERTAESGKEDVGSFGRKGETDGSENLPYICKYQSADRIWRRVLLLGGECLAGRPPTGGRIQETEILGIYTLSGGYGRTRLGLFMGQILAEQGRTLFLTLEEFSALPFFMDGEIPEAELSELYYFYSQGGLTAARLQAAVCRRGRLDMIAPVKGPEDLYREGKPYEPGFFKHMAETGDYRWIVLDMGNDLAGKTELLGECSRLFLLENGYGEGQATPDPIVPQWERVRTGAVISWLTGLGLEGRIVRCGFPPGGSGCGAVGRELAGAAENQIRRLLERCGLIPGEKREKFIAAGTDK